MARGPTLFNPKIDDRRPFFARVETVDPSTGKCTLGFYRPNDKAYDIVVAQPYAGRGWGVFCGVEPGTIVMCIQDADRKIYIIGYMPDITWYADSLDSRPQADFNEFSYPRVQPGEIAFQSKAYAQLVLNKFGDISLQTPGGNRFVLDEESDTIEQLSAQRITTCEAYRAVSGAIKRDIRTLDEKAAEPLTGSGSAFGYNIDETTEYIGFDPSYKPDAAPALDPTLLSGDTQSNISASAKTDIQQSFSNLPKGLADLSLGDSGSSLYRSDAVNPPLAEIFEQFYEFADTNVGLDQQLVTDELRAIGKWDNNVLGRKVLGTHVNEIGKILRFDYGFYDGKMGRGQMWKTEGIKTHTDGQSTDEYFDRTNTLLEPKGELREDFEWTVETLEKTDAATMFDFTLRTRGFNYDGVPEKEKTGGVNWFVRVAKDGLTKLNIPAATSLNAKEFHREGRSLIANLDGSLEATIGKQLCTGEKGLDRVTGVSDDRATFVNMNNYPNYGRKDRSVALDLAGNLELSVGGDSNNNQSIMVQADGSLAAFFGKEAPNAIASVTPGSNAPISTACLARNRTDRSITIRTLGNAEMHINKDEEQQQSIMISTEGGNRLMCGKDVRGRSLDIHTLGGIRIEVQGPETGGASYQGKKYALEIDLEGNMHIYVNGAVDIHSSGDMRLQSGKDFHLDVGANFYANVVGNAFWTIGQNIATSIGQNESVAVGVNSSKAIGGLESVSAQKGVNVTSGANIQHTATAVYSFQGASAINADGAIINFNQGLSIPAVVVPPTPPQPPKEIFVSQPERAPILGDIEATQEVAPEKPSDIVVAGPVTNKLEETIDPKTNRVINPFEES